MGVVLSLCARDQHHGHDHSLGEAPPTRTIPVTQTAPMPMYDPPSFEDGFEEVPSEPPPSYVRFDPHPPGCNCAIHIKSGSHPIVIELFQSQGCSDCPPTNSNVHSVLRNSYDPNFLFLDYHVTYWDHLGWKDIYGNDAFNTRQWDYARRMGKEHVYTPQIIVNGVSEGTGNTERGIKDVVKRGQDARKKEFWVTIDRVENGVIVRGPRDRKGRVFVVTYDTRRTEVAVRTGENLGMRLQFTNVVKEFADQGDWMGGEQMFSVQRSEVSSRAKVVLVQEGKGGAIIGVAKI